MPNYNGTGPFGEGPMTGRGMGYCILKQDKESPSITYGVTGLAGNYYQRESRQQIKTNIPRKYSSGQTGMRTLRGYPAPRYLNPSFLWPVGRPAQTSLLCRPGFIKYTGHPFLAWICGKNRGRRWRHGCFFRF